MEAQRSSLHFQNRTACTTRLRVLDVPGGPGTSLDEIRRCWRGECRRVLPPTAILDDRRSSAPCGARVVQMSPAPVRDLG